MPDTYPTLLLIVNETSWMRKKKKISPSCGFVCSRVIQAVSPQAVSQKIFP